MMNVIFRAAMSLACAHFTALPSKFAPRSVAMACLSVFIPFTAWAQPAHLDPLNAQVTVQPIIYQSAFSDYKPYQDPEWMSWRTANDVVREFGSMAGMAGMEDMKGSESPDAKTGKGEQANQPAKPSHDMSNMQPEAPAPGPKKPAPPGSNPEMKNMPGHDMSKMPSPKPKTTPPPKVAPPTGTKNKGVMTDMPGHDMGSMQQKAPPAPKTKSSPSTDKPAVPAPMTMPNHGAMSK